MATQNARKKRFGSRRRVPNQNEMSKADESQITDNTFVDHSPEENAESLNVYANPDNSQSETQHSPSAEISGNRRKLGSSRRNKGQCVKNSATESFDKRSEEVGEKTMVKDTMTKMSLAIQPEMEDVLSQGSEQMSPTLEGYLYSAPTPDYSSKVLNATTINCPEAELESLIPKSEDMQAHHNENEAESIVVSDSCKLVETMQEGIEKSHTLLSEEVKESAQDGKLQSIFLVSESHVESVFKQFSTTPDITTENICPIENTEIECIVGQATQQKEELPTGEEQIEHLNISEVKVAHLLEDDVDKVHEPKIQLTEIAQINDSFESVIHDARENSEICSGNLTDPTKSSDTYRTGLIPKSANSTNHDISNPDDLQDEHPTKESNFEALEQNIEDYHVYDTKEPQISDIERVDAELGQIYEFEDRIEDNTKHSAEQTGHQEKKGLVFDMEESESSLQTQQSELNSPFDSQPQHSNTAFNSIGNKRKLGSSRRNKGKQHVKDTVAEHIKDNETTEMPLTTETAIEKKSMETMLQGMDKCDTAQTEDVSDQRTEHARVGTLVDDSELTSSNLQSSSTVDQQTVDQSNVREVPDDERPSVWSVTEKESNETDDNTELFRQNMSEDIYSSIAPEITTELHSSGEHTDHECSVEQTLFLSSSEELPTNDGQNEIFNSPEVEGAHQSDDDVNEVHEQEVKLTQMQEMPQIDFSFQSVIRDATENFEILSGNLIDPTKMSDTYQSELIGGKNDDSPTNQDMSNPEKLQEEHPTKESNFEALEQNIEDYHVYDTKEPQISDIERVDAELGQIYEFEDRIEDNTKHSAEQTGHQEKKGLVSDMEESESSLQTQQSELNSPFDSQPQHSNTAFNSIGNKRKLGSSRRNKGKQHVKDTVAEHIKDNEPHETTETAIEKKSMETMLQGMDKCDTAQTEAVSDQITEHARVGTHFVTVLHSSSTIDQQMLDQSNLRQMPGEEIPNIWSVTEKESNETDNDTKLFRQNVMSEDIDYSITPDITKELHSSGEHTDMDVSLQRTSKQKRRKMGSTHQTPLNRKPEERRGETKDGDCNTKADMINLDKMEAMDLPVIVTTDASQNPKSSLSLFNKEEETNETSTICNNGQNLQISSLQILPSDMISDSDYSEVIFPEKSVTRNEVVNPVIFAQIADVKDSESSVDMSVEPSQIDDFTATEMHLTSVLAGRNSINQLWSASTDDNANTGITEGSVVSLCETTQSTQNEEETSECINVIQDQALKSAEAPVVTDLEIVKSVARVGAGEEPSSAQANNQKTDNMKEVTQTEILEMKNASPKFDSANRRRKIGSTRRNLGSQTKREDLHQKQEVDNDATEAATNVGDVKTKRFSGITEDDLKLHIEHIDSGPEQRKEKVFETEEYIHTGESYLKPHHTFEENPVSDVQLVDTEDQLTPNYIPKIPSTSPKHDSTSESASSGRRRKMGSHRKSHQNNENQTARGERITDKQNVSGVRSITDESAIKTTEELRDESLGLDRISEVNKSDKKPSSNISTLKEGEQPVSEITPEPVTPVHPPYTEIRLGQGSQQTFSLEGHSRGPDLQSNALNVMMVGDSSVGKTSFMKRAQSGKFSLDLPASVGLDSCMWPVVVDGKPLVLQLWDTAGQERFHSLTRQIFYKAHAFLLMYDITSSQSFSAVSYWASCIQEGAAENVTVLLVGNKSDSSERQVKTQKGEILAKEYNFGFTECSAATGENVVQSLETVARMLSQKVDTREEALVLHKEPKQKKSAGCC